MKTKHSFFLWALILAFSTCDFPFESSEGGVLYLDFTGKVNESNTYLPIPGIEVTLIKEGQGDTLATLTDRHGRYTFSDVLNDEYRYRLLFTDIDSTLNGWYYNLDTLIRFRPEYQTHFVRQIDVALTPRQKTRQTR